MRQTRSGRPRNLAAAAGAAGGVVILALVLGSDAICLSKLALGLPCPGCGLTRAFLSAFRGDMAAAFTWHPLFPAIPIVIGILIAKNTRAGGLLYRSNLFWAIVIGLFMAAWAARMVLLFPWVPPMDYNEHSLLWTAVSALWSLLRL